MKINFLNNLNLKWKFVTVVTLIILVVCSAQNVFFYYWDKRLLGEGIQNKVTVVADVIADNSTAAVQFLNRSDALEVLGSLRYEPAVDEAYLFDAQGGLLAAYPAGHSHPVPIKPEVSAKIILGDEDVVVHRPILLDNKSIGMLYLRANLDKLHNQSRLRLLVGGGSMLVVFMLALLLALWCQRFFIHPVLALSNLSRQIAQKKSYGLRACKQSNDEVGVLVENFNIMLETIQARDKALDRKSRELEHSNKELEQFAYVISHDLKSPLVTIQGFAERFIKYSAAGEQDKAKDAAKRVQNAAMRMGQLIDDVLELSRIGRREGHRKTIKPDDEINKLKEDLQGDLEAVGAQLLIEGALPEVWADAVEMRQVFQNLISNAIKYACPQPGTCISVGGAVAEGKVKIYVRDQGPGIARDYHHKIFQLFQRIDTNKQGTGLGLAIVAKVMKNLGGHAWVESEFGNGATFWLAFPAP